MTTQPEPKCRICKLPFSQHNVRHPFDDGSGNIQLPEKDTKSRKKVDPGQVAAAGVAAVITRLVLTLVRKGWLTEREGEYVLTGREPHENYADPAGGGAAHVAGGEESTAERGVRDPAGPSTPGGLHNRDAEQVPRAP